MSAEPMHPPSQVAIEVFVSRECAYVIHWIAGMNRQPLGEFIETCVRAYAVANVKKALSGELNEQALRSLNVTIEGQAKRSH